MYPTSATSEYLMNTDQTRTSLSGRGLSATVPPDSNELLQ